MGYMNHRHGLIRQSVLGLQTLTNIVFAMALIMSQSSWAATSPVTIGGPFTLIAPDGTTVTDFAYQVSDQLGSYWVLASGNNVLDAQGNTIARPTAPLSLFGGVITS